MNTYRWSFLSVGYLKLHARITVIRCIEYRTRKVQKRIKADEKERVILYY
jgi:hypothetical protein